MPHEPRSTQGHLYIAERDNRRRKVDGRTGDHHASGTGVADSGDGARRPARSCVSRTHAGPRPPAVDLRCRQSPYSSGRSLHGSDRTIGGWASLPTPDGRRRAERHRWSSDHRDGSDGVYSARRRAVYRITGTRIWPSRRTDEQGYSGDDGPAPRSLPGRRAWLSGRSLYLADTENHVIRRTTSTGVITTARARKTAETAPPAALASTGWLPPRWDALHRRQRAHRSAAAIGTPDMEPQHLSSSTV